MKIKKEGVYDYLGYFKYIIQANMGLRFIYGTAGTGKTTYCFNEIKNRINHEHKIYVITPEQFSFTAERKLLEIAPNGAAINAEVLTFGRMAHRVCLEVGGAATPVLTECGNAILLYDILESKKGEIKFLGKTDKNIELVSIIFTEMKKHGISVEKLKESIDNTQDMYLKTKLNDIYILYKEYEERIAENYIDSNDLLTKLAEKIDDSAMFNNAVIYIDEFAGFTEQEYILIKKLLKKAKQVNITICTDWLENNGSQENDIYYQNKITAQKIVKLIEDEEIENPVILKEKHRFRNIELKHLEENIYNNKYKKYNDEPNNIQLFLSMNPYSEIEYVAKEIIKLVRDNGYKYKDIAIITKQIDNYSGITKAVFGKYEIPVFIDEKKDLSQNYLIKYILAIFEIFSKNYNYEAMFNYIKTGLIDISEQDIFKLENYCIKWGIKGNKWYKEDWIYGNLSADELTDLNDLRKKIITPLIQLKDEMSKQKTVESISKELYDFLQSNEILTKLKEKIERFEEIGQTELANEYETGINVLVQVLDELVMIFKDKKVSFEKYRELIKIGLQNKGLGAIPATQDQVTLGDVDRSRSHNVKAVFIIGINDGIFPSVNKDEGFLNDKDREDLQNIGMELAKTTTDRLYEEQFNIYKALTVAEEKLYLSYTSTDSEGRAIRPSVLITKIKKIFPSMKEKSDIIQKDSFIGLPEETFDELLENIYNLYNGEEIEQIWKAVYNWYNQNPEWHDKLQNAMNGLTYTNLPNAINKDNIDKLYGNKMQTSVSKLEQYRTCPFSFHLKYGLRLKEEEKFEIKSIDTGTFMHDVIDEFFDRVKNKEIDVKNIPEEEIEKIVRGILYEKLLLAKNAMFTSTNKFKILLRKLEKVVIQSVKYIVQSLAYSNFEVLGNEVEFKHGGEYPPIELNLEDGRKVEITGKIDRIDIAEGEKGKYIRIVDYKSSVKNIELNEVMFGLQLQLITYLDEVVSKQDYFPAGILYFNLIDPIITAASNKTEEEIKNEINKNFKMKGLVLADLNIIKMMDTKLEKGYSNLVPVYIGKEGHISQNLSNAIDEYDFANLQKKVRKIIKEISNEILNGDISIKPYYNKDKKTPCEYCNYKTICNFNTKQKGNNYNYIKYIEKSEILEEIRKEAEQNV